MPILSTAKQSLARMAALIQTLGNPRDRAMLTQFRNHWRGEVTPDLDAAMAVLPEDSFFSVKGVMTSGEAFEIRGAAAHRAVYQHMIDAGLNPGGAFHDELFAFADWGMMMEAVYSNVVYGPMLSNMGDYDPKQLYLFHAPLTMVCPFSPEGRMLGKRDYIAAPMSIEPVERDTLERLVAL